MPLSSSILTLKHVQMTHLMLLLLRQYFYLSVRKRIVSLLHHSVLNKYLFNLQ